MAMASSIGVELQITFSITSPCGRNLAISQTFASDRRNLPFSGRFAHWPRGRIRTSDRRERHSSLLICLVSVEFGNCWMGVAVLCYFAYSSNFYYRARFVGQCIGFRFLEKKKGTESRGFSLSLSFRRL